MDHADHVALIQDGVVDTGGIWADFGSGTGAFTLALAELVGVNGRFYSIDQKRDALHYQQQSIRNRFPGLQIEYITADYTQPLDLPLLDGAVMANALHFQHQQDDVVQLIYHYLRPGGRFVLVEYNVDHGNHWVPYPLSYQSWETIAQRNGFVDTQLLAIRPSRFLHGIYAAVSRKPLK